MKAKKAICKNCKHEIIIFRGKVSHVEDSTVVGKQLDVQAYKICDCGCDNPEPKIISRRGNK